MSSAGNSASITWNWGQLQNPEGGLRCTAPHFAPSPGPGDSLQICFLAHRECLDPRKQTSNLSEEFHDRKSSMDSQEMAQSVQCLLGKHEDKFNPQKLYKK